MKTSFDLIMGKNALLELLKVRPGVFFEILTIDKQNDARGHKILQMASNHGIKVTNTSKKNLSSLVQSESHQNFAAKIHKRKKWDLDELLRKLETKKFQRLLLLDSILDPQNMGAILRAAECFGIDGVIYSKNRSCPLSAVVSKASSGALDLVSLVEVSNLAQSIKQLQKEGFWVVTSEIDKQAKNLANYTFSEKSALVMGSEGEGVRALLSKYADEKIYIPMSGQVDSLNVSQATAVILYQWMAKS